MVTFRLNEEFVEVPQEAIHLSTAAFVRQYTQCKSIKVSCSEGGCGACAVELLSPEGGGPVVAVNSCLLPVAALNGCQVITSEGLGNTRQGYHEVQERLAAFHGTQCGFCSPGIAVSCHAALMAAAHKAADSTSTSSSSSSCESPCSSNATGSNGSSCHEEGSGRCGGQGTCKGKQQAAAAAGGGCGVGVTRVTARDLLGALDGNLCRCTGWRPIADCAKSFACDVDIEDLGLNSLSPDRLGPISLKNLTPAALKQQQQPNHLPNIPQDQQAAAYATALRQLQPGSILAPASLAQLLQALEAAAGCGLSVHLVGGNTGAGLYKGQWGALSSSVCVLVRGVRELQQLSLQQTPTATPAAGPDSGADGAIDGFIAASGSNGSNGSNGQNGKEATKLGHANAHSSSSSGTSGGAGGPVLVAGSGVTITRVIEALQDAADALSNSNTTTTTNNSNTTTLNQQSSAVQEGAPLADSSAAPKSNSSTGVTQGPASGSKSAAAAAGVGQQDVQNLQYMVTHMRRIAGTLVRNAATLGGHLALVRGSHLESDLVTLMMAAGARVCITCSDGGCHWMDLDTFCGCDTAAQQQQQHASVLQQLDKQQAVITAVQLPLPITHLPHSSNSSNGSNGSNGSSSSSSGSVSFWSHKLTNHRSHNEHATVNASIWLSGPDSSSSSSSSTSTGGYQLRIAVGTYQAAVDRMPLNITSPGADTDRLVQQQQPDAPAAAGDEGGVWMCVRTRHLETAVLQALQQQQQQQQEEGVCVEGSSSRSSASLLEGVLGRLPDLLLQDIQPAGRLAGYVRRVLPGLLLKGLAAVLPQHTLTQQQQDSSSSSTGVDPSLSLLLELRGAAAADLSSSAGAGVFVCGRQDLPVDLEAAPPLYWPTERDGGVLQASGEAVYADDVPLVSGALYAAYVNSTTPYATLLGVDCSNALNTPGVVGWVGPEDIPAGPNACVQHSWTGDNQPLFAHTHVTHVGQPLGLILAKTPTAAQQGAARVKVTYGPVTHNSSGSSGSGSSNEVAAGGEAEAAGSNGSSGSSVWGGQAAALTSLSAAVAADSWYDLGKMSMPSSASKGDVGAALSSSARVLRGQVKVGSQRHFYMEPQTAVATPDEGGRLHVVSSCQGCDLVMYGICRALKLRHNEVHVTSKRVGGGFGGKAHASTFHATAAALAAHKFRRQVRLVVPQSVDVGMAAGRCPMVMDWRAGVDEGGRLQALSLNLTLMDGAFGGGAIEAVSMKSVADNCYDIPHMAVSIRMARTHMPSRSTVRGPGKVSMIILLELMMQQLAATLGVDPHTFRTTHMIQLPPHALAAAAAAQEAAAAAKEAAAAAEEAAEEAVGAAEEAAPAGADPPPTPTPPQQQQKASGVANQQQQQQQQQEVSVPHPQYLANNSSGDDSSSSSSDDSSSSSSSKLQTALGQVIELHQYTLPYMWQMMQQSSSYADRRAAVDAFNARHSSRKRGLALVPVRYPLFHSFYTGRVTIYTDGSVLLSHAGVEIGQGISSKVKATAAASLGALLPPSARPSLLPFIRVAGGSTELMPHAGLAAGSTTSEGATAAIAAVCEELVGRLQGAADQLAAEGKELSWEAIVKGVCGWEVRTTKVLLTASARSGLHEESASSPGVLYHSFGVGAVEVEVDCVTGERQLMRADLMFDAGRSVSPAIDMGQIEGAFMQGVGHVMTEEVIEDEVTGSSLSDTSWTYKPPGIAELPKVFNVAMLRDSPCHVPQRKQLSAKATGEPPMMLAAAVACALQDAIAAAWSQHQQPQGGQGQCPSLELPATIANILQALPPMQL